MRACLILTLACLWLSGCATYSSLPLSRQPHFAAGTSDLIAPVREFRSPGVRVKKINLNTPLDSIAVAVLAVLNNPMLAATRASENVASAQSYAAGLLPWPDITLGRGRADPSAPGLSTPWSVDVEQNAAALIQHGVIARAAEASQRQVHLAVLWDEWQVAQQARLLYARIEAEHAEHDALAPLATLCRAHLNAARTDVVSHAVSREQLVQAEAAYASVVAQLGAIRLRQDRDMTALRGLLGLAPQASLALALDDHPKIVNPETIRTAMIALPHRRPDLMALAAAYSSADDRLRQAILAQFPLIGISIHRERDTEGTLSNGLSLTLNLPFLNGARGEIAVAQATRQHLHAVYQARLNDAVTNVVSLRTEAVDLQNQLADLNRAMGQVPTQAELHVGTVAFDVLSSYLAHRSQIMVNIARVRASLDETTIALDTLLGMPLDSPSHTLTHAPS